MTKSKRRLLLSLPLLGLCLQGCTPLDYDGGVSRDLSYHDGFKILQLTDLHYCLGTDTDYLESYMDRLYAETAPDLVVLTGDLFMTANKAAVFSLLDYLEGKEVDYAFTFGNHDFQGLYSPSWLCNVLSDHATYPHSLFVKNDSSARVEGRSNYVINLVEGEATKYQIYLFDTMTAGNGFFDLGYANLDESQVEWYKRMSDFSRGPESPEDYIPSIFYFHVPIPAYQEAHDYEGPLKTYEGGYALESLSGSTDDQGLFEEAVKRNCLAMFCGHNHADTYTVTYQGVTLGFGVKTGPELYYGHVEKEDSPYGEGFDLMGASLLTLGDEEEISLTHYFLSRDMKTLYMDVHL